MKHKKFSDAILCGYKLVDGRQHFGSYSNGAAEVYRMSVCVLGAASLCEYGNPDSRPINDYREPEFAAAFREAWGVMPNVLNDDGMPWEHIYGMAKAAGL